MSQISLGLVGCGAAARRYYLPILELYPEISKHLYLVDKNIGRAQSMAREIGSPYYTDDYHDILGKVKGVIIIVPHFLHYSVAMDFLHNKTHVLCEKPLAESIKDAKEMVHEAEINNVNLLVNNTRRVFPNFKKVKQLISNGEIGNLLSISYFEANKFEWESETDFYISSKISTKGVLLDSGSHVLDLICWWLDGKPDLISYEDDSYGGPESVVSLKAKKDSCYVKVRLNRLINIVNKFLINGELGSIEGSLYDWKSVYIKSNTSKKTKKIKIKSSIKVFSDMMKPIIANFINVINRTERPLIQGKDVINSIELIDECYNNRSRFKMPWYQNAEALLTSHNKNKILVTGASGFIGARTVETLHLLGSRMVRAGVRKWVSCARIGRFPVEITKVDILNEEEIRHALEGISFVVHCAYGPEGVTVDGTRNILKAALEKKVERVIHISTTEVYGDASGEIDEEYNCQYTGNPYGDSKLEAEKICFEFIKKGLPIVILRPPIVYGPFSRNWTINIANMLCAGEWGIFDKFGDGKCNLLYVDDLVRAIMKTLKHKSAVGQVFNINGPEVITWNEYLQRFNRNLGLPELNKIRPLNATLRSRFFEPVRILGNYIRNNHMEIAKKIADRIDLAKKVMKKTEEVLKATPSQEQLNLFGRNVTYKITKAKELLGYEPQISIDEGLKITADWIKHQGFLSG